ncbi:MAG: hypothetical protein ACOCZV_00550 [Nanoarchaeota archaeon]
MELISCVTPYWFSFSQIVIQLIFTIVTFLIAYKSYSVYKICNQRTSKLYAYGFLGVTIGYLMQALLHTFVVANVSSNDIISVVSQEMARTSTIQLSAIPVIIGMVATLIGLSIIAFVTLRVKNEQVLLLTMILALISIITPFYPITYHLTASVFLIFITIQYYRRFEEKRTGNSQTVFLGFLFILLGTILLTLTKMMSATYIIGHFVALFGYILLLWSLMKVVRK